MRCSNLSNATYSQIETEICRSLCKYESSAFPISTLHLPTASDVPGTDHIVFYKSPHRYLVNSI